MDFVEVLIMGESEILGEIKSIVEIVKLRDQEQIADEDSKLFFALSLLQKRIFWLISSKSIFSTKFREEIMHLSFTDLIWVQTPFWMNNFEAKSIK